MATLSSVGIASGIDSSVINSLVALERAPKTLLATAATKINTQISAFGKLQSAVSAFRDAAAALSQNSGWDATAATSADDSSVAVSSTTAARVGSYDVKVTSLAAAQQTVTPAFSEGRTAIVGQGTLRIELGSWSADQSAFTANPDAAIDIEIGAASETLEGVRDKINAAGAGVTATIVNGSAGAQLMLRSTTTGAANGFQLSVQSNAGGYSDTDGLSRLLGDGSSTKVATDAAAEINGIAVTSATNTLADTVDGMTITLKKVTTAPVTLTVAQDTTALKTALTTFATSYSDLAKLVASQTKYDAATKTGGPLQGDRSAVSLQSMLRSAMGSTSGATTAFSRLSDVGLELQKDGTLTVNDGKLTTAMGKMSDMKKLFTNVDSVTPGNNGLAVNLRKLTDAMLSTDGAVTSHTAALQKRLSDNQKAQDRVEEHAVLAEKRIRAQYERLDTQMSKMNALSAYVTQQMSALSSSS
jgi:flagellar hook-associated protein 2